MKERRTEERDSVRLVDASVRAANVPSDILREKEKVFQTHSIIILSAKRAMNSPLVGLSLEE